jgi:hypothetical protein
VIEEIFPSLPIEAIEEVEVVAAAPILIPSRKDFTPLRL